MQKRVTFRLQYIRCGKSTCGGCPHGPYWYAFWKESGRTRSRYIGKRNPHEASEGPQREASESVTPQKPHKWAAILNRRTATLSLACTILEVTEDSDFAMTQKAFGRMARIYHPDRGGDHDTMICLEAAFSFIKQYKNWK